MGEYRRLISYIYSYEKGIKSKNSGFAKIESRNGICKVSISVRISDILLNETKDNMLEVFLFSRKADKIRKIFIGQIKIVNGCSNFRTQINFANKELNDIKFLDVSGIFICSKNFLYKKNNINIIYASEWDDIAIKVEEFTDVEENEQEKSLDNTDNLEIIEFIKADSDEIEELDENVINETEEKSEHKIEKNIIDENKEYNNDVDNDENKEIVYTVENETENKDECERELKEILIAAENKSKEQGFFEELASCYSKINVEEIEGECIKISPKDISYLPKKYWHLSNNSFLLHSFYNYRYILLCENNLDNNNTYKICVPGMFHNKEQAMARMFGFSEFKCKGQKEIMKFGYWCINL